MARRKWAVVVGAAVVVAALAFAVGRMRSRDAAVDACIDAIEASKDIQDPYVRGAHLAQECSALYSERGCRDAFAKAWAKETDPSQRSRIMAEGCRDAYCPNLPEPKPALCSQENPNLVTASETWPAFNAVVHARDLGPERAARVTAAMKKLSRDGPR